MSKNKLPLNRESLDAKKKLFVLTNLLLLNSLVNFLLFFFLLESSSSSDESYLNGFLVFILYFTFKGFNSVALATSLLASSTRKRINLKSSPNAKVT